MMGLRKDPIRIMRGIRFATEKGFQIEEVTLESMKRNSYRLAEISVEKIRDEFIKLMGARFTGSGDRLYDGNWRYKSCWR